MHPRRASPRGNRYGKYAAASLAVPAQGQLRKLAGGIEMQISSRVVSGTHHIVNLPFENIDLAGFGIELAPLLVELSAAMDHRVAIA